MTRHNVKFVVALSNGETIHEGKGEYEEHEGELSPWQRLLSHLIKERATVTSLGLYTDDGQRWNLPSMGEKPKFKAFDLAPKPLDFTLFRAIGADVAGYRLTPQEIENLREYDHFTVAEAVYADYKLQIWVSEHNPRVSWTLVVNTK